MINTCEMIFQAQHLKMKKIIPLCEYISERYHFIIFIIISIICHHFIDIELHKLAYEKNQG